MIIVKNETFDDGFPKKVAAYCDNCGEITEMKKHGIYEKYNVSYEENHTKTTLITVPRYRCVKCKKTHVAINENHIPYSSYDRSMKEKVLYDYQKKESTVEELCTYYQISVDLLYTWIHK